MELENTEYIIGVQVDRFALPLLESINAEMFKYYLNTLSGVFKNSSSSSTRSRRSP